MPDILLIQPSVEDFYLTAKRTQPYGLAIIASALRQSGFTVEILDALATARSRVIPWPDHMAYLTPYYGRPDHAPFALFHCYRRYGYSMTHLLQQVRASGAFLVGISSLFTAYSDTAFEMARGVKSVCPETVVVLGGHHPTALPEEALRHPAVDCVIRGDGEIGLPLLATALREKKQAGDVPGLCRRRSDGTIAIVPPAVNHDLDGQPDPAFDLIDWRHYNRAKRGSLSMSATRGCPLRCTYCAVNAATYHGYRRRSAESVLRELDAAFKQTVHGFIDFEDEHLSADKAWFMALMEGIAGRYGKHGLEIRAMNGLFAPSLDEAMLAAWARAGGRMVNLALVTTHAGQLKRYGRPDVVPALDRVLHWSHVLKMQCVAYLIVAGPGQEPRHSVDDLLYLAARRVLAGVSVFYPAPGSADYRWCQRKKRLPADYGLMRSTALPLVHRTNRDQAVTLLRLGRVLNFMKHLIDTGQTLPPAAKAPARIPVGTDRIAAGKQLLGAMLNDGRVYGVDADGRVYAHRVDLTLTRHFLEGLERMAIRGAVR